VRREPRPARLTGDDPVPVVAAGNGRLGPVKPDPLVAAETARLFTAACPQRLQ